jgi:hypothetical protein
MAVVACEPAREPQGQQAQRCPTADRVPILAIERTGEARCIVGARVLLGVASPQSREHSQRIVGPSAQKR